MVGFALLAVYILPAHPPKLRLVAIDLHWSLLTVLPHQLKTTAHAEYNYEIR